MAPPQQSARPRPHGCASGRQVSRGAIRWHAASIEHHRAWSSASALTSQGAKEEMGAQCAIALSMPICRRAAGIAGMNRSCAALRQSAMGGGLGRCMPRQFAGTGNEAALPQAQIRSAARPSFPSIASPEDEPSGRGGSTCAGRSWAIHPILMVVADNGDSNDCNDQMPTLPHREPGQRHGEPCQIVHRLRPRREHRDQRWRVGRCPDHRR